MLAKQSYYAERSEKAKTLSEFFKAKMVESLNDCGRYKSAIVDQETKKVDAETDIPEELKQAYIEMMRAGVKARLIDDADYKKLKGTGRYDYLDQL